MEIKTCCSSVDPEIDDTRSNLGTCNNKQTELPVMKKALLLFYSISHFGTTEPVIIIGTTLYLFKKNTFSCI